MTSTLTKSRRPPRLIWREENGVVCADGRCMAYRLRPMPGRKSRVMASAHPAGKLPILPVPAGLTLRSAKALCQQAENAFARAGRSGEAYLLEGLLRFPD